MNLKKYLSHDIYKSTYMSNASRQPYPKGRTAQPGSHSPAAVSALARSGPETGPELFHLRTPSLSLPGASTATQAPRPGRRCQSILHRQAFAPSRGTTPRLRRFDRIDLERDRQPCLLGGPATWGRSWLTDAQSVANRPSGIPLRPIIAGQVGSGLRAAGVGPAPTDCYQPSARKLPGGGE